MKKKTAKLIRQRVQEAAIADEALYTLTYTWVRRLWLKILWIAPFARSYFENKYTQQLERQTKRADRKIYQETKREYKKLR